MPLLDDTITVEANKLESKRLKLFFIQVFNAIQLLEANDAHITLTYLVNYSRYTKFRSKLLLTRMSVHHCCCEIVR